MRKHLLSLFGNLRESEYVCKNKEIEILNSTEPFLKGGGTSETRNLENSDQDEFVFCGPTRITETIENTDIDEFLLQGPTRVTFTQECTDEDEFLLNVIENPCDIDFDEILLI